MASFEIYKPQLQIQRNSRAECKSAPLYFWEKPKWQNNYHHADPWGKLPQNHIWHATHLNLKSTCKFKRNDGLHCKITITPIFRGENCKMNITNMISGQNYPKIIYWI